VNATLLWSGGRVWGIGPRLILSKAQKSAETNAPSPPIEQGEEDLHWPIPATPDRPIAPMWQRHQDNWNHAVATQRAHAHPTASAPVQRVATEINADLARLMTPSASVLLSSSSRTV
jgi:hypothetical protein